MSNPQQPELGGNPVPGPAATPIPDPGRPSGGAPVPPGNQPGHHPQVEQDKPTGPPPEPRKANAAKPKAKARTATPGPGARATKRTKAGRREFDLRFAPMFRVPAALFGVRPGNAKVIVTDDGVDVRFGPWHMSIDRENVAGACVTGPYNPLKVIGPAHLGLGDRGVTFGTNRDVGVCIQLKEPQAGIAPLGLLKHPAVTVTVDDPVALAELLRTGRLRPSFFP